MASGPTLIRRYYLYRATVSVGFVTPVFTLFLLRDLTFTQVGALSALYSILAVVGELPTGYVGDRWGRRASLLLSVVFTVASLAGFVLAQSFLWYTILYALWALALTFRSGSMDAWLYDALATESATDSFARVRGRGDAVQQWASVVTMVAGGALYGLDPRYPFVAAVAFNSLGVVALLSLPRNPGFGRDTAEGDDTGPETGEPPGAAVGEPAGVTAGQESDAVRDAGLSPLDALRVIRDHLARPPLRSLVVYFGLFYAAVSVAGGYVQPMAVETLGPLAADLGVAVPADGAIEAARSGDVGPTLALGLGVLYAALAAVASVGGWYAGPLEERIGVRGVLLLVPVIVAVALGLPLALAVLAIPAFAALNVSLPLVRPVVNGYVNDHVESAGRGTTLSAASMGYMVLRTPLALAAGVLADATTATAAVAALGGLILVGGGVVWLVGTVAPPRSRSAETS